MSIKTAKETIERNRQFVIRHFNELVNKKNLSVIEQNLAPGFFDHDGPNKDAVEQGRARLKSMYERYPDLHIDMKDVIADGDKVVVRAIWSGTDSSTGKPANWQGFVLWRLSDEKFVERWATISELAPQSLTW